MPKITLIKFNGMNNTSASQPPLISTFTDERVKEFISTGKKLDDLSILNIPCHTQAVERSVQLVVESAVTNFGYDARDR